MQYDLIILGGGAAGVFAACNAAEMNPQLSILLLEKSNKLMSKIRISGGGRCNVTHACFDPKQLVKNYPRGHKELLSCFYQFQPSDTIDWFERHGVALKTEPDGRMFPESNTSATIINCLQKTMDLGKVKIAASTHVSQLSHIDSLWHVIAEENSFTARYLLIATGSSPLALEWVCRLGHTIVPQVPSLFTFQIIDQRIAEIPGLSVPDALIKIEGTKFESSGPLLITHSGLSGPGILKLSAFAARELAQINYNFTIKVQWDSKYKSEKALDYIHQWRGDYAKQTWTTVNPFKMPQRLWLSLLKNTAISTQKKWGELNKRELNHMAESICKCFFQVTGKSTFKEEFVTAGGVALNEIDFRTMESKIQPNLFFAGEVLDIDGITGGFNFQAAWTTSYLAAKEISSDKKAI
jgi:predicted Rossmann fold flavoprotein